MEGRGNMLSKFFIDRPRFAFVISIVISLAGLIAIKTLPVTQYPNITPSQVSITTSYPGADAMKVLETVIQPIESQINSVRDVLYISSVSSDSGMASITVTCGIGTDGAMNTVNVQNYANRANAQLPQEVQRQTIVTKEKSSNILMVIALYSPDGSKDALYLNNYASIKLKDELSRISGVSDVMLLSELKYAMRIWLNPEKLAALNLSVDDVTDAIKAQNVQVSSGAIGEAPGGIDQRMRFSVQTQGRLSDVEEFKSIIIRSENDGSNVKIGDVAQVEFAAESYNGNGQYNGKPAALLAIYQLNGANGIALSEACCAKMDELKQYFTSGVDYAVPYDTTKFIKSSIEEVVITLIEAVLLVILVTFIFLQDWRATLVPTLAIPVSLIGTFAVLQCIGYSINLITLFGLILAIGIVVDDAIVVIENVNRLMEEEHLSPYEAAVKSMQEVTGPVIATTAVLLAMFIPICFLSGITGEMYRQFGITIAVAVTISSINALTLSPALSSILLKPSDGKKGKFILFRWFDAGFEKITGFYGATVGKLIKISFVLMLIYGIMTLVAIRMFNQLPTGFIPDEDQAAMFINVQLPDGASLARTEAVLDKINKILLPVKEDGSVGRYPGVADVLSSPGFSVLTGVNSANNAMIIVALDDWEERQAPGMTQNEIIAKLTHEFRSIPEAVVSPFGVPVISGIGVSSGFSFVLEDTNGTDPQRLQNAANELVAAANQDPRLQNVFTTFRASVPQVYLKIDREKVLKLGVDLNRINAALQGLLGYTYVNDLNQFGKVYKVEVQAEGKFRSSVDNLSQIFVPNKNGEMVPLSTLIEVEDKVGPQYINRYNLYASVNINGSPAPGVSSGEAMKAMEELADKLLPEGMKYDWTDMSYQEKQSQGQVGLVFALALLFIYLFLVAQYESWMIPLSVLLAVPVAFLGALSLLYLMGVDNNLYVQVGLVLLFGIACKTAILIVEFAKVKHEVGMPIAQAASFAAKLRFRAVLMTAVSFILGTIPLLTASGAGAASRHSLGAAVVGGMLFSIVLGTFLIPAFYVVIQSVTEKFCGRKQ